MKKKISIWHIVLLSVNVVLLAVSFILSSVGKSMAESQVYNYSAQRWGNGNADYTQLSCFFSDDSEFTIDSVYAVRSEELSSLKKISVTEEEGKTLIPDAYSTSFGTASVRCDIMGRSEAEITVAGGNFFLFRDFRLLDGAFFSDDDTLNDIAVIDSSLAWSLYGSDNVAGMNIYINGIKFIISGVIETPKTKYEKKTYGEFPKAYISYDGAALLSASSEGIKYNKVSCYECIMPDPVENYAFNTLENYFEGGYKSKYKLVNNTNRFDSSVRSKAFKNLSEFAVRDNTVIFPYWENASAIVEFKTTSLFYFSRVFLILPLLTLLAAVIILFIRLKNFSKKAASDAVEHFKTKAYEKQIKQNEENDNQSGKEKQP